MVILGALVNGIATVAGGTIGLAFKSRVSTRLGDFLMQGMGLVVLLVAISGMAKGGDIIVVVLSMIAGAFSAISSESTAGFAAWAIGLRIG